MTISGHVQVYCRPCLLLDDVVAAPLIAGVWGDQFICIPPPGPRLPSLGGACEQRPGTLIIVIVTSVPRPGIAMLHRHHWRSYHWSTQAWHCHAAQAPPAFLPLEYPGLTLPCCTGNTGVPTNGWSAQIYHRAHWWPYTTRLFIFGLATILVFFH